jgi:hypothetical protein
MIASRGADMDHLRSRVVPGLRVAAMGAALVLPADGQSMADAARRERERRAKQAGTSAKAYTDADLEGRGGTPAAKPSPGAAAGSASDQATRAELDAEAADRRRLQAEWRVRFAGARRRVSEAEARCWHKVVKTVFVSGIPVQQWVDEFQESDELRERKSELADLDEEYRRAGLPPGWVRE